MTERRQNSVSPDVRFFTGTILLGLAATVALLFVYAWDRGLADWLLAQTVRPVHVVADCRPASEHEQLHIVTWTHEGRILGRCLYVGSTGTYYRKPRR